MKRLLASILLWGAVVRLHSAALTHRLQVEIVPQFGHAPLVFDATTNTTAARQQVSVTRLDFLLSNIALRRADGGWLGLSNWFAYVSAREGRTRFELEGIPEAVYDRVRFQVGVPVDVNHANPAQHPPGHPLNPTVNGLHWSWQGGYVFFAVEGTWQTTTPQTEAATGNAMAGYSFHLATDRQLMTVELPVAFDLMFDQQLRLALNIDGIFARPNVIALSEGTASTHSREGDALADQLRENIARAFAVEANEAPANVRDLSSSRRERTGVRETILIASNATPYPFTFSQFFPQPALPLDNPLTEEGVYLGALLFFDPRLSINGAQSCASCHERQAAFTDPGRPTSPGAEGQTGTRNTMPLFNLAWKPSFFWDGRAPSLREQVLQPIQNPIEMHETLDNAVAKLKSSRVNARHRARALQSVQPAEPGVDPRLLKSTATEVKNDYPSLFSYAFGTPEITADRMARALEQFLLVQVSCDSKFDRVVRGETKLTVEEQRGFELFHTEYDPRRGQFGADCFHCHGGPLFQSQTFANNGLDSAFKDLGRSLVTKKDGDKGKFAVPSLRNVAVTAPYMHDGRFATLEQAIEHYSTGIERSTTLDPNLAKHPGRGVPLTDTDKKALLAFLKTLTDEQFPLNP